MLHFDVLKLISLQLDPHKLSINKELHGIYNDTWYHEKLVLSYPNLNLFTITNYKDLYKKSLEQGTISSTIDLKNFHELSIKGVKASLHSCNDNMILTFNGDLFCNEVLIDTNVVDITVDAYIKTDELYIYPLDIDWIKITLEKKLFRIEYDVCSEYHVILTEDGILLYKEPNELHFIEIKDIVTFVTNKYLYILNDKEEVYSTDPSNANFILTCRDDIKIKNNTLYNNNDEIIYIESDPIYDLTDIKVIPFKQNPQKLGNFDGYTIILSSGKCHIFMCIFYFEDTGIILNNVKNMFTDDTGRFYVIK
jgi:hypothetical protein